MIPKDILRYIKIY